MKIQHSIQPDFDKYIVYILDANGRELHRYKANTRPDAEAIVTHWRHHYEGFKPAAVTKEPLIKDPKPPTFTIKEVTLTMVEMADMLEAYKHRLYLQKKNKLPEPEIKSFLKNYLMANIIKG